MIKMACVAAARAEQRQTQMKECPRCKTRNELPTVDMQRFDACCRACGKKLFVRRTVPRKKTFDDQDEYDRIGLCRKCGAENLADLDYCGKCGRKLKNERRRKDRGETDMVDALARGFGSRIAEFCRGVDPRDREYLFDLKEALFGGGQE